MNNVFKAIKISDSVYWIGAIDWAIRDFHGYATTRGTTYNAYVILADKVTLVDTVKKPFLDEFMSRLRSVIEPEKIDYIISNHAEMDHSGALPEVIEMVNPEKIFASKAGAEILNHHFHWDVDIEHVKTGDTIDLGNMHMKTIETRMLHWPESMFSYLEEEKILFSQDAFGMHLATSQRFTDEVEPGIVRYESAKYYANILMPYSRLITRLIDQVGKLELDIRIIAHTHGPVWRDNFEEIMGWYSEWAQQKTYPKAVLVYDTMWGSTAKMADAIADGIISTGVEAKQMPLSGCHRSDVATHLLEAGALVVGSPTLNNMLFPTVADVLSYLKGLKPKGLVAGAFSSYGWSGESLKQIKEYFEAMKLELAGEVRAKYVPNETALKECFQMGKTIGEKVLGGIHEKV